MTSVILSKSSESDINRIMNIIKTAQNYFESQGVDQWQNDYPNREVIKEDMRKDNSYVLKKDGVVVGIVAVIFDGEETYNTIYNGRWLSQGEYGVIHRMAIDFNYKGSGLASDFLKEIEKLTRKNKIYSMKVDTHRDNIPMKKLLLKNDYKECGVIYLNDGSERIGFEKILKK